MSTAGLAIQIDLDILLTGLAIVAALAGAAALIWLEKRSRPLGQPRLVPTTPLLFVCALVLLLALAHLMSIVTGSPHVGRLQPGALQILHF